MGSRYDSAIRKTLEQAVAAAGIGKPVSGHTFRHPFAARLLEHRTEVAWA
ncbi:tyrosine-type recombinase/integrase [Zobellella sp. DQSA1]